MKPEYGGAYRARAFKTIPMAGSFPRPSDEGLGGAYRDRTDDPLLAKQVLSQLS